MYLVNIKNALSHMEKERENTTINGSNKKKSVVHLDTASGSEVLGYLPYERLRCTYAKHRHLQSYSKSYG